MSEPLCRFCRVPLTMSFADLGMSPLSNSYLSSQGLSRMEPFYPLHAYVCKECRLVQLEEFESPKNIFSDYSYFSSYSDSWLRHCQNYAEMMVRRFGFGSQSRVVEVASNDGYLLQYFKAAGVPVLGIEPAANVAKVAMEKGIPSEVAFFGVDTARILVAKGWDADLLVGNNVLAHVPDINDFVEGIKTVLKPSGVVTMEFPHLLRLIEGSQFDTIYHEHFSYLSFGTVERIFAAHGLRLFDVDELPTHGGSLRIYACHRDGPHATTPRVASLHAVEAKAGLNDLATYEGFERKIQKVKRDLLTFLIRVKEQSLHVVGYGAPAKGNTLLNYCGVRSDLVDYTVDLSPHKQNRFLPGTHISILHPDQIAKTKPDYVLILPWNIKDEIIRQMSHVREWGGRFVVAVPDLQVIE
jgi:SAM-dependent methyltransferase